MDIAKIKIILKNPRFLIFLILLFYGCDALTKLCYYRGCEFHNFSAIARGAFFLLSIGASLFALNPLRKKVLLFFGLLTTLFFIGQYAFLPTGFNETLFDNFIYLSRYLFIFSFVIFYNGISNIPVSKGALTSFEGIIAINSLAIIVGLIYDIEVFRTYEGPRFGYSGFFMVPSITTFFYAIALSYLSLHFFKNLWYKFLFTLVIICGFIIGTKAFLLFMTITLFHLFLKFKVYKNKFFYILSSVIIGFVFLFRENLSGIFKEKLSVLLQVYRQYDFITMATSFRNINIKTDLIEMAENHWGAINFFVGGTDFNTFRVEFDFLDVFLFFGILGGALYFLYYFKYILNFKMLTTFGKIQILFLLGIALLSGTFFNNAPIAIYLLLLILIFSNMSGKNDKFDNILTK